MNLALLAAAHDALADLPADTRPGLALLALGAALTLAEAGRPESGWPEPASHYGKAAVSLATALVLLVKHRPSLTLLKAAEALRAALAERAAGVDHQAADAGARASAGVAALPGAAVRGGR